MAGLVPAIHDFLSSCKKEDVDARHKAGHDGERATYAKEFDYINCVELFNRPLTIRKTPLPGVASR